MPNKINFTREGLERMTLPPAGKRVYWYDTKAKGLMVQITSGGRRTFYVYRWIAARPERIRLGTFPDVTIEQARRKAAEIGGEIAKGANPAEERRAARREAKEEMTLDQLFELWMGDAKDRKRSWKEDEAQRRRYLGELDRRRLSTIKRADVRTLHKRIGRENGPYAANRLLALVRAVFNFAIEQHELKLSNPAQGVEPFPESKRRRRLMSDELPAFFQAVAEEPNGDIRDYVLMSLLTGARRANVLAMRWDDIHFDRATWEIGADESKNGEPMTVPLTQPALEVLRERRTATASDGFVFPGPGTTGHLQEPKKGWARIVKRAGLSDLRLHDLRRSLGSWQVDTGASLAIIGQTLGHKSAAATAVYARLSSDPVRQSMEKATAAMLTAGGVRKPADVVRLSKRTAG